MKIVSAEQIYKEIVGTCSQNTDYEDKIKVRVLKAMEEYRKQGRFYTPAEIRIIQNTSYDAGLAASFSEGH